MLVDHQKKEHHPPSKNCISKLNAFLAFLLQETQVQISKIALVVIINNNKNLQLQEKNYILPWYNIYILGKRVDDPLDVGGGGGFVRE